MEVENSSKESAGVVQEEWHVQVYDRDNYPDHCTYRGTCTGDKIR